MLEDKIIVKLSEHDRRFEEHDKRFDKIDKRFDEHDKLFDKIITKLVEHDQRFEEMATKVELSALRDEILQGQDKMMVILNRLDQESASTNFLLRKVTDKVEIHDQDILKIKTRLEMA
ncbi:MAG: hypothetical protein HY979_00275 [Candidatus Magasanikbacteria bacterium]|nr:hypothetical protein [Candidatus Magasanikbacteria bacterium]